MREGPWNSVRLFALHAEFPVKTILKTSGLLTGATRLGPEAPLLSKYFFLYKEPILQNGGVRVEVEALIHPQQAP